MKLKTSNSILFSWYYVSIITLILVIGLGATIYTYKTVARNTQKTLLKDTASIATAFNTSDIISLRGNEEDLTSPIYLSLKDKLETIRATNEEVRFIYFLGYKENQAFFYLDSEPDTSEDYSPPGQIYEEATDLDKEILKGEKNDGIEFSSDRWGSWFTSLVSIKEGDKVTAVLGMDMSSKKYFRNLYIHTSVPLISTIFVLSLFLIGFFLRRREKEFIVLKEKLLSVATHDLRSPLTAISWLTESMLDNKEKMSPESEENIKQVHQKITALLASVNTLLSSTEEGKIKKKTENKIEKKND